MPKKKLVLVAIDIRRSTCTRCSDPKKPVVAIFYTDLSGAHLCACADCFVPTMEATHGRREIDDVQANFTRDDVERERTRH